MKKTLYTWMVAAAIAVAVLNTGVAHAQDAQTCQPGLAQAYTGPHNAKYQTIVNVLVPQLGLITGQLGTLTNQATYQNLLNTANTLAASLPTGRVVITLPDGTVVIDTARDDNTASANSNSYQHFLDKTINENHNSRMAILAAQQWACGIGLESKLSTTTGLTESYVAVRIGPLLDNLGTVRMSIVQ